MKEEPVKKEHGRAGQVRRRPEESERRRQRRDGWMGQAGCIKQKRCVGRDVRSGRREAKVKADGLWEGSGTSDEG